MKNKDKLLEKAIESSLAIDYLEMILHMTGASFPDAVGGVYGMEDVTLMLLGFDENMPDHVYTNFKKILRKWNGSRTDTGILPSNCVVDCKKELLELADKEMSR